MVPLLVRPQPQPHTKVTLTQATLRQSQNFIASVFPNWPWYVFTLCCYQRVLVNLSEKAIKQRRPTTMITIIITVNNQAKQDEVTVNIEIADGGLFALLRHFPAHLIFFRVCFPSGSWCTASWAQHMQYGTMRSVALALTQTALGPSERQAAVCWLLSAKWGQFALGVSVSLWGCKGWHTGRRIKYGW